MDMSKSFMSGVLSHFPKADFVFENSQIFFKVLNESVGMVGKSERKETNRLKGPFHTSIQQGQSLA